MSEYSRRVINPWSWQDELAYVQGVEVTGGRTLYLAGTTAIDADGNLVHVGDIRGQVMHALDSIETILRESDMGWEHLVRLNWYIKGSALDDFWAMFPEFKQRLEDVGCHASSTVLGVERLAQPELLCEVEATAVAPPL